MGRAPARSGVARPDAVVALYAYFSPFCALVSRFFGRATPDARERVPRTGMRTQPSGGGLCCICCKTVHAKSVFPPRNRCRTFNRVPRCAISRGEPVIITQRYHSRCGSTLEYQLPPGTGFARSRMLWVIALTLRYLRSAPIGSKNYLLTGRA